MPQSASEFLLFFINATKCCRINFFFDFLSALQGGSEVLVFWFLINATKGFKSSFLIQRRLVLQKYFFWFLINAEKCFRSMFFWFLINATKCCRITYFCFLSTPQSAADVFFWFLMNAAKWCGIFFLIS